jgi:hypothetical protein
MASCQKCGYVNVNPIGCISCGWKFDPNYHPEVGASPIETATWITSQSFENLEKLYGQAEAGNRLAAARALLATQKTGANFAPAPPMVAPVISHTVEPVASPFAKPEPPLFADSQIHATEAPAPGTN